MADNRLISWLQVPDDSTLRIEVEGSDDNFNVTGIQTDRPGGSQLVPHNELVNGYSRDLQSPVGYAVTISIAFLGEEETTVTTSAEVIKPDGTHYGAFREPHEAKGKREETDAMVVLAITQKNGTAS